VRVVWCVQDIFLGTMRLRCGKEVRRAARRQQEVDDADRLLFFCGVRGTRYAAADVIDSRRYAKIFPHRRPS